MSISKANLILILGGLAALAAFVYFTPPTHAAITFVQATSTGATDYDTGGINSVAAQFSSNVTTGDAIIVAITDNTATSTVTGCRDTNNATSSYQRATQIFDGSNDYGVEIWFATGVTGGTKPTVTCTFNTPVAYTDIAAHEYSGVAASAALDVTSTVLDDLGTGSLTTGTSTTHAAGELIFGAFANTSGVWTSFTAGGGFTARRNDATTAGLASEDEDQLAAGSAVATGTAAPTTDDWVGAMATFEASTASSTPSISYFTASPSIVSSSTASTLSWGVTNASSVAISPDGGFSTTTLIGTTNVSPTTTTIYTLSAVNNNGTSTATTTVTVDNTVPTTPGSLTATSSNSSQINLTWSASTDSGGTGIYGYDVYQCTGSSCVPTTLVGTSSATSYTASSLSASTTYSFAVTAYNGANTQSAKSTTATATTLNTNIDVYANFESGTNGATITTSTMISGTACDIAPGGAWSLDASTSYETVETTAEMPLIGSITCNGTSYPANDGTRGIEWNLNDGGNTGSAQFSWTPSSTSASDGIWMYVGVPTSDTGYYSMFVVGNENGDFVSNMIHSGQIYIEVGGNPNGADTVGTPFNYTANTWYWVTDQYNSYVNSSTLDYMDIYSTSGTLLSSQAKNASSSLDSGHLPYVISVGKGGDTGGSAGELIYFDNFLADTTGSTFPILPGVSTPAFSCDTLLIDFCSTDYFIRGQIGSIFGNSVSTDFELQNSASPLTLPVMTSTDFEITSGVLSPIYKPVRPQYTQVHYQWRNDNGTEATATSATAGNEDTPLTSLTQNTSIRIRAEISNDGGTILNYSPQSFQLQYGLLSTTCSAISSWTVVGAPGAVWGMYNSSNLTDGQNTTNIATSAGGVAAANHTFITSNAGVKTTTSTVAANSVPSDSFMVTEFDVEALTSSTPNATYCFRLTNSGSSVNFVYSQYPQATLLGPITIGNGTQNAPVTIGPGSATTTSDIFTFTTSSGTSTITNVTTTLATTTGVGLVEVTNASGTTVFGSSTNLVASSTNLSSTTIDIALSGMNVSTTATTFDILIQPKNFASMPTGAGRGMYVVTSTITGWTDILGSPQAGANTTSSVVTIDNQPPNPVTNASGTAATSQVLFSWTNPTSTYFAGTIVLRATSTLATTTYRIGPNGTDPVAIAFDGTNMWTANEGGNSVTKVSPTGVTTTYSIGAGTLPYGIAFDGTNMWTANYSGDSVTKVSPTGVTTTYKLGAATAAGTNGIAFDGTNMWTANYSGNSVTKVSPTGVTTTYGIGAGAEPYGIAFDGTNMWTANNGGNSVTKVSPTGVTTTYGIGAGTTPLGIAFDGTNMWTANEGGNSVTKISPTGVTTTYGIGAGTAPYGIAFDGTNMWTANEGGNSVTKISPTGVTTTYSIGAGAEPFAIAFDGTSMWTADFGTSSVTKVMPLNPVPVAGTTYTLGQTIGSSVVACVVASSTSGCTDSGLTNGTQYYYDIFTYDSFANYSTGVIPVGSPFTPGSSQAITLTLNTSTVTFPGLSPGIAVTASTTATVAVSGASSGYTVSIQRNSATSTLANASSSIITFPDYLAWAPSGTTCAPGQGNGTTTPGNTLSFRVASSGTTANYCSAWWGASDLTGAAIYAGVPTTSQVIVNSTSSISQNGTTTMEIIYSANAPANQNTGNYSGGVTITALALP